MTGRVDANATKAHRLDPVADWTLVSSSPLLVQPHRALLALPATEPTSRRGG